MTNDGGTADEPTSYGLQPPARDGQGAQGEQGERQVLPGGKGRRGPDAPGRATEGSAEDRLLGGRYRLLDRLGHGGMGTVWRAHDEIVDRDVAVKEPRLPDDVPENQREVLYERMRREARTAARIDHPSVVTIHDVVVENGRPWIVMELVQGSSLADFLAEGTLDPREAARIGLAVAGALEAVHEKSVLHRDVKPDNVLLGRYDRVVLTDFGIARAEGEPGLTETGVFVGSPEFIAPERVLGQRPGPESDLWSLGVLLYMAVEGVSPFRRNTAEGTLEAVRSYRPARPQNAGGAFLDLIMALLQKNPADRPSVSEARQVLEETARPRPPVIPPPDVLGPGLGLGLPTFLRTFAHNVRTRRAWRFGTGGVAVVLVAALVLLFVDPFDSGPFGGGLPDGWETRDEANQIEATLAVPSDYRRSEQSGVVTFISKDKDFSIDVTLGEAEGNAVDEANARLEWYKDPVSNDWKYDNADEGSVTSVKYKGKKAAELDSPYTPWNKDGKHRRVRELVYVNGNADEWHLALEAPDGDASAREQSKRMFEDLVAHFDVNQL